MNKFYTKSLLALVTAIFFMPTLINFNANTLAAGYNYISQAIPFLLVFFMLLIWVFGARNIRHLRISRVATFLFVAAVLLALQYAWMKPSYSAAFLITFCLFITSCCLIILINNSDISSESLLNAAAIGILINGYYQVFYSSLLLANLDFSTTFIIYGSSDPYYILVKWFKYPGQIVGSIGQVNVLADLLCWGIVANCWLGKSNSRFAKVFFYLTAIVFSIFIALSQSRTAYLYVLILASYLFYINKINKESWLVRKLAFSLLIMAVCLSAFYINAHFFHVNTGSVVPRAAENNHLSNFGRYIMWAKGLVIFLQHPLIGGGWDSYSHYYAITTLPDFIKPVHSYLATPANAHNLIIHLLATTGIVGTLLTIYIIGSIFLQLKKQPLSIQFLPAAILLVTLTHSMLEYPLFYSFVFIGLVLLIAITDTSKVKVTIPINLFKAISLIIVIGGSWQVFTGVNNYLILAEYKKPANYQVKNQLANEFNRYFEVSTNPLWDDYADITLAYNLMFNSKNEDNTQYFELYKNTLDKINQQFPNPPYTLKLAIMEVIDNNPIKAKSLIKELQYNYPGFNDTFESYVIQQTPNNTSARNSVIKLITDKR